MNPNWPGIVNSYHSVVQRPSDKSDIIVTVYKLEELIQDIKSGKMFGPCKCRYVFFLFPPILSCGSK
jgi:hypothetical protein